MNVKQSIDLYLDYARNQRRMSPFTVKAYETDLLRFLGFLNALDITDVEQISPREPRQFQAICMQDGLAPRSILRMLSSLRGWNKFLLRSELLHTDFMARTTAPHTPKNQPVSFRREEAEHIYDLATFPDTFAGHRNRLLLRMLYETGIRRSEAASILTSSIDVGARTLRIVGKRNKERIIPLQQELLNAINSYLVIRQTISSDDPHLFLSEKGKPISPQQIYTIVRTCMTPLSNADHVSPHVFRHTFASLILNQGGNIDAIKELLGHSSLNATEIYTHVSQQHLLQSYKQAHPRANTKKQS